MSGGKKSSKKETAGIPLFFFFLIPEFDLNKFREEEKLVVFLGWLRSTPHRWRLGIVGNVGIPHKQGCGKMLI